jgi:hypothetical protein
MPAHFFRPGDECWCKATVCNAEGEPLNGYPLFVILDIHGFYFFAPSMRPFIDNYIDELPVIPEGSTEITVIPGFLWPENAGTLRRIVWYGFMTDPELTKVIGDMGIWRFGWGE